MSRISGSESGQLQVTKIEPLAADQERALELLLSGKSVTEAASGAGVGRTTLYRWMKQDPAFVAAFNQWQDELHESCRSRLLTMTNQAANAVEQALQRGDARTALQLLKGLGMIRERTPGPTDAEEVRRLTEVERTKRRTSLNRQERRARSDELSAKMGIDGAEYMKD